MNEHRPVKTCHVIIDLNIGGAEVMLKRLIESDPDSIPFTRVVSLTSLGEVGVSMRALGIHVDTLGMSSIWRVPIVFLRLIALMRQYQPSIVQTWMYHADLIGGLAARLAGVHGVVYGVRSTAIPQGTLSFTYWLVRLCSFSSWFVPKRIICCANSAKLAHIKLGYAAKKITVIPNGYDFSLFEAGSISRSQSRGELGFKDGDIVIGVVGRFDPLKDFHSFVTAAACMAAKRGDIKFLMVGRGNEWSNVTLRGWIEGAGLAERFKLIGQQTDVAYFLSAMDIFCLSSVNEAFPNVVVEAMAMGLPCVVTRAGDAAEILGDDDFVVPVMDSVALSDALLRMCDLDRDTRRRLGERGASKVRAEYGIRNIRMKYEAVYDEVARK